MWVGEAPTDTGRWPPPLCDPLPHFLLQLTVRWEPVTDRLQLVHLLHIMQRSSRESATTIMFSSFAFFLVLLGLYIDLSKRSSINYCPHMCSRNRSACRVQDSFWQEIRVPIQCWRIVKSRHSEETISRYGHGPLQSSSFHW